MDRLRRARLPARQAPRLRRAADDAEGMDAISGDDPFIMMARRPRLAVLAERPARRAAADALRADRVAGATTSCIPNVGANPVGDHLEARGEPAQPEPERRPTIPHVASTFRLTEHHTAGPDEPQPAVARRAAARDVRRDRPGARRRARHRGRRLDGDRDRARRDRGAREGHQPHPAAADRRPHGAPDLPAVALGHVHDLRAGRHGRLAQRPAWRCPATRTCRSRIKTFSLQGPRRPPRRARRRRSSRTRASAGAPDDGPARAPSSRTSSADTPEHGPTAAPTGRSEMRRATEIAVHARGPERMGFFTDTTVCIGCKACEVACKQWNDLPADGSTSASGGSLDYTGSPVGVAPGATCASSRRSSRRPSSSERAQRAARRAERAAGMPRPAGARRGPGGAGAGVRSTTSCSILVERAESGAVATLGDGADALAIVDARGAAGPLGVHLRRLQALHERRLPRRLPDRRADPDGVRDRHRPARHLQRLRLLRRRRARSASSTATPTTAAPRSARSATTACRTASSPRARRPARPTRSSSGRTTSSSSGAAARGRAARARARGRVPLRRRRRARATSSRAASARSSCSPSRPSATGCRRRPTRRPRRTARRRRRPGSPPPRSPRRPRCARSRIAPPEARR